MPKENTSVYIILGLLSHEDLSGYDIKKRIDHSISNFWEIGYGQIYPTLSRLEKDGLVAKRTSETSGGPEKNLYSITGEGKAHLAKWLKLPEQKEYTKYEILVKLFFGSKTAMEDNIKRIGTFKARHEQNAGMMEVYKENLRKVIDQSEDHLFYYLTVMFGERIYKAYVEWADDALELLKRSNKYQEGDNHETSKS